MDDRLAAYGFKTNTGTKFVAVVDMRGRRVDGRGGGGGAGGHGGGGHQGGLTQGGAAAAASSVGLREGEMKVVSTSIGYSRMGVGGEDTAKEAGILMVWDRGQEMEKEGRTQMLTQETGLQGDADGVHQVVAEPLL